MAFFLKKNKPRKEIIIRTSNKKLNLHIWGHTSLIICLILLTVHPCFAKDRSFSRFDIFLTDLNTSPRLWTHGFKNLKGRKELFILGTGAAATLISWQWHDDIQKEIERHPIHKNISSVGDVYAMVLRSAAASPNWEYIFWDWERKIEIYVSSVL